MSRPRLAPLLAVLAAVLPAPLFAAEALVSPSGTPVALVLFPTGGGNHDINVIHDGVKPAIANGENAGDSALQYDTYDGQNGATEDWIGYEFTCSFSFTRVVFQEGKHFNNGGYFDPPESLVVQVKDATTGDWATAAGDWDPPYPGQFTNGEIVDFETFTWTAAAPVAGTGIRIYGQPGGSAAFVSCAELEAYADKPGPPPEISLSVTPPGGPAPLDVTFDASGSKGEDLSFAWDFGDGSTSTDPAAAHTFTSNGPYTVKLTVSSDQGGCTLIAEKTVTVFVGDGLAALGRAVSSVMAPTGGGNHDINVIRDGVKPDVTIGINAGSSAEQYDTYDGPNVVTEEWIGYEFDATYDFASVVFQEGKHFDNGGYFDPPETMVVQVRDPASGDWAEAAGSWDPPYQGLNTDGQVRDFETFLWTADQVVSGTGIRVFGQPGGAAAFISCAELEVFTRPGAEVNRIVESQVFGIGDTLQVILSITMKVGDTISIDEIVPPGSTVSEISDGGIVTGSTIHWDLTGVGRSEVRYKLTPSPCSTEPRFGTSTWRAGLSLGLVGGPDGLTLDVADRPLGGWTALDLDSPGSLAQPLAAHEVLVKGTGAGIKPSGTKDGFRFVEHPASGDFEVTARIDCFDDPGGKGQAGIMVRDTTDASSAHAFFYISSSVITPGSLGSLGGSYRKVTGTPAARNQGVSLQQRDVLSLPVYLRLRRGAGTGGKTLLTFERSDDGAAYTEIGSKEIGPTALDLKDAVLVGLAVTGTGDSAAAIFRDVTGPEFPTGAGQPAFRRGDADASGKVDLTDAVIILGYLFQGGATPTCLDALDTNDSGKIDLTDAVFLLAFLFQGGASPPAPGPFTCGPDTTASTSIAAPCVYAKCP